MSQERFDNGMEDLKQFYNSARPATSSKEIFQSIQQQKGRSSIQRYWPMLAATLGIFVIGGILLGSIISGGGTEMGQSPGSDELPLTTGSDNEHGDGSGVDTGDDQGETTGDHEDATTVEDADSNAESNDNDTNQPLVVDRPETLTKTITLEGMEEQTTYDLYVSEEFGISSYLLEGVDVQIDSSDQRIEKYIHTELFHFSMTEIGTGSDAITEWEAKINETYQSEGFSKASLENDILEGLPVEEHTLWTAESNGYTDQFRHAIFIQGNDTMYFLEAEFTIEMLEGRFPYAVETFIKELEFHQ
ncbi:MULTISPECIES: hypothetical protein [Bacillaceae]|uniref:DUF1795 domain-containing protein n=1 Tax=Evansella alkalicola TaxID=745819 RepID=A0ABS6JU54_9BACI|nr:MULTISPECIES: hypothetical protein [Bacillaceae]MBU9720777.1 hypothetical protein [Bacillus alkalicola]